jgi:hypothetical protein
MMGKVLIARAVGSATSLQPSVFSSRIFQKTRLPGVSNAEGCIIQHPCGQAPGALGHAPSMASVRALGNRPCAQWEPEVEQGARNLTLIKSTCWQAVCRPHGAWSWERATEGVSALA